jgi:Fanconi-associated nuclease 1
MNHCGNGEDKFREALQVVTAGLEDPLVHISEPFSLSMTISHAYSPVFQVYRPSLERRLTRLEIRLKVPEAERHICEGYLQQPETTTLKGRRFYEKRSSVVSTTGARQSPFEKPSGQSKNDGSRWKGKSIWWGKKEHVNVETLMLESWEAKGYKG